MEELKRLEAGEVPLLRSVWIHQNDVVGIDENGEPVILAHLAGNEGAQGLKQERKRSHRKKSKEQSAAPPLTEQT